MSERLTITLPWPSKTLSPNARVHWRRVADVKQIAKRDAFYATRSARREPIEAGSLIAKVSFFPPDRRARDTDNMIASMKAAFDGIAQAIGVDDSRWQLQVAPVGDPVKLGKVQIHLEWTA